jgi:addiction module HigA family antidote
MCFEWPKETPGPSNVEIVDYHKRKDKADASHTHSPGEIFGDELEETGLSAKKLADLIKVPPNRLYQVLAGKRNITADTALRLSKYFGTSADFWINLQTTYELDLTPLLITKSVPIKFGS